MRIRSFILILTLGFMAVSAEGAGWNLTLPHSLALGGVRTTGMNDAENLMLNPASLAKVEQNKVLATAGLQMTTMKISNNQGTSESIESDDTIHPVGNISVVWDMGTRLAGFGITLTSFDHYKLTFPSGGRQRFQCDEFSFNSYLLQTGIGFVPVRDLSIGISVGFLISDGEWDFTDNPFKETSDPDPVYDIEWKVKGDSYKDYTANLGLIWSPSYRFELGFVYQPPLAYHLGTDVSLDFPEELGGGSIHSDLHDIRITIPQEIHLGFHWIAAERLDLFMDVGWEQYSQIDPIELAPDKAHEPALPASTIIPVDLDDRWSVRMGGEVLLTDFVTVRLGGYFLTDIGTEGTEPIVFDTGSKTGITGGLGIRFSQSVLDLVVGHQFSGSHDISGDQLPFPISGDLDSKDTFISVGMTFNF